MSNMPNTETLPCTICDSSSRYAFTSKHRHPIYECSAIDCGHFFTPVLSADQGICIRDEDLERESDTSLRTFDERNIRLLKLLRREVLDRRPRPWALLDFGAGNAHIARTFKRRLGSRATLYCLEANPVCEGFYARHGLIQVKDLDDFHAPVDLVYMIEVIEHLKDPITVLRDLVTILKQGGAIFLSTPIGRRDEADTNAYDTPSHVQFFTPASLNLALQKAGLTPISYGYFPQMYPLPERRPPVQAAKHAVNVLLGRSPPDPKPGPPPQLGHLVGFTRPA